MSQRRRLIASVALTALAAALVPATASAADRIDGSGRTATEARNVGAFQAVASRGSIDVTVRQGAAHAVEVRADDNLLPYLETFVENGRHGPTLQVRWKPNLSLRTRSDAHVSVTMPTLAALAGAGSGDFKVIAMQTPSLNVALSGSGDVVLDGLKTDDLSLSVAGSSDIRGAGEAAKLAISIAGSGDVDLMSMKSADVSISIAGSGDAKVQAHKTLKISIAGSGDVVYSGDAQVSSRVAGSGNVSKR